MAIRIIVKDPDPVLREIAKPVSKVSSNIQKLLNDMADTMYDAEGVGLAAPQIGILKRVIVIDSREGQGLVEMINPEIVSSEGEQTETLEGCLSIPGVYGEVRRKKTIVTKALDRNGNEFTLEAEDYLARIIQHEIDHLNGILFTDLAEALYESRPDNSKVRRR